MDTGIMKVFKNFCRLLFIPAGIIVIVMLFHQFGHSIVFIAAFITALTITLLVINFVDNKFRK